jgi:hypothetical protein
MSTAQLCWSTRRLAYALALSLALAACSGVPLKSIPQLAKLSGDLQDANPAEFMVALQLDARLTPPAGAVPLLTIKLQPRDAGAFETVDKKLPLQLTTSNAALMGLEAPAPGRRWMVYSLPGPSASELARIQAIIKKARADGKGGGSLGIGVEQDSLTNTDPALDNTRWNTWLQTRQSAGFFELWNGTLAQLKAMGKRSP